MEKTSLVKIREIFSRHDNADINKTIFYNKLEKIRGHDVNGKKFDILYSLHETAWHFDAIWAKIESTYKDNKNISDSDFILSAIIFIEVWDKIRSICEEINFEIMDIDYSQILTNSVYISSNIIDINDDANKVKTLKNMGMLRKNEKNYSTEVPFSLSWNILRRTRNKLVHPNSSFYDAIHIGGNFSSSWGKYDNKTFFEFKTSFHGSEGYRINKNVYIRAMKILYEYIEQNISKLNNQIIKKMANIRKNSSNWLNPKHVKAKLNEHTYGSHERAKILENVYDQANLYLVAKFLKNEDMQNFIIDNIIIHNYFEWNGNENIYNWKYGDFSLRDDVNNFIRNAHNDLQDRSSSAYAVEKFGYWSDDEVRSYFPKISRKIDKLYSEKIPLEMKVNANIAQKLDWSTKYKKQKNFMEKIKKMNMEEFILFDPYRD